MRFQRKNSLQRIEIATQIARKRIKCIYAGIQKTDQINRSTKQQYLQHTRQKHGSEKENGSISFNI